MNTPAPMTTEEWLALGNTPTVLAPGYTAFPDGNIPMRKGRFLTEQEQEARNKAIAAQNAEVQRLKEEERAARRAEAARRKQEKRANAERRTKAQLAKAKAPKLKQPKPKPVKPLKLVQFKQFPEKYWRGQVNRMLKQDAMKLGSKIFVGLCAHHGKTAFAITKDGRAKCAHCTRAGQVYTADHLRITAVKKARTEAIAAGKTEFTAECRKHGPTTYRVITRNKSECVKCRQQHNSISNERERLIRLEARRLASQAAISEGQRVFMFECREHGMTAFRVRASGYSECIECRKAYERSRSDRLPSTRGQHSAANQLRRLQALERGERHFTGICNKHGETRFSLQEKHRPLFRCLACHRENGRERFAYRQQRYLANPRTMELNQWFDGQPKGRKKEFAELLGISPQRLQHYFSGSGVIPEDRYQVFLQFKERYKDSKK